MSECICWDYETPDIECTCGAREETRRARVRDMRPHQIRHSAEHAIGLAIGLLCHSLRCVHWGLWREVDADLPERACDEGLAFIDYLRVVQ